jgi:hypothetical protein
MYVLVHHTIADPERFWATAQAAAPNVPAGLTLHHTISAKDGSRATCLWEAESVSAVRDFLEPGLGASARNEYSEAENRDGVVVPPRYAAASVAK